MKKIIYSSIVVYLVPVLLFAQGQSFKTEALLERTRQILNTVIGLAFLLAFLFFVWGLADFIRKAGEPAAREEGRKRMVWGIIALAVLATIWGIVAWLQGEFGVQGGPATLLQQFKLP